MELQCFAKRQAVGNRPNIDMLLFLFFPGDPAPGKVPQTTPCSQVLGCLQRSKTGSGRMLQGGEGPEQVKIPVTAVGVRNSLGTTVGSARGDLLWQWDVYFLQAAHHVNLVVSKYLFIEGG